MTVNQAQDVANAGGAYGFADDLDHGHDGLADHDHHHDHDEPSMGIQPRDVSEGDRLRFEAYLSEILIALGLDLRTPGTSATARRLLDALFDMTAGYEGDSKLLTAFPTE